MSVSPRLAAIYRRTHYLVGAVPVRVGRRSPAIDALLRRHGVWTCVLLTAWNPLSRARPERWNRRAQSALREAARRHRVMDGTGGLYRWSEDHLLLLADRRPALVLARRFRQRAVILLSRGRRARLMIL